MMRITSSILILFAVASSAAGGLPNYLFPDMVPFVVEDEIYLQNWDISGSNLRVETVYANFGDGLFEIRSGQDIGGGEIEVLQRVYIDNDFGGQFEDFVIDAAINNHEGHGHIHFEDFSRFSLHEMTLDGGVIGIGNEVAASRKTSFRLSANRGPLRPEYVGFPNQGSSNSGIQQRISVGYGDRYSRTTDGQSFSIDGLPTNQLYWLRQHVDPDNNLMESDETNNMFEILIDLDEQGVALLKFDGTFLQPGDLESELPGSPIITGDMDLDDDIDLIDWGFFQDRFNDPLTGTPADLQLSDLNLDGLRDIADVFLFRSAYEQFNGGASLGNGSQVPEPPGMLLLVTGITLVFLVRGYPCRPFRQLPGAK